MDIRSKHLLKKLIWGDAIFPGGPSAPFMSVRLVTNALPNEWVITFNEDVTSTAVGFTLRINGSPANITGVTGTGTSVLTFTTTETVLYGDVLTIDYDSGTGNCLSVGTGLELISATGRIVLNLVSDLAPLLSSAVVEDADANDWILTFNEAVTSPAAGWALKINGTPATITNVADSGTSVLTFTTTETVIDTDTLTLDYDTGTGNCLSVDSSTELETITADPVTNNVIEAVAPVLQTITVEDAQDTLIVLTYDEALNESSTPANGDFSPNLGKAVTNVVVSGLTVTLTVDSSYVEADVITLSYTAGVNPIEDLVGNPAANLITQAVTNNVLNAIPVASSVVLTETSGVYSLGYAYSNTGAINEAFQETQWKSITFDTIPEVGGLVTAIVDPLPVDTYTYKWYVSDDNQGTNDTEISGATSISYTPILADLNKHLRIEVTDQNSDMYSSYYAQVGQPATLEYAMVEEGATTSIVLVFDRDMGITDETGWTSEKNDVANVVTAVSIFENIITLTVTNAIVQHDLLTVSYDSGTGNTIAWVGSLALGDIDDRIVDNFIGASFGNEIRFNFMFFNAFGGGANWNDLDFTYHGAQDNTLSNLVDETGANTGASISILAAESFNADEGNSNLTLTTAHITEDAWKNVWQLYDDNGDNQEVSTWRINGLPPNQMYRIWMGYIQKGFGTMGYHVYRTQGHALFSPAILPASEETGEASYSAMTDANGDLVITQKAHSSGQGAISTTQLQAKGPGFVIEPVSDFDPRAYAFEVLLLPQGADVFNNTEIWKNWGNSGEDAIVVPTYNKPTWNLATREMEFTRADSDFVQLNSGIGSGNTPFEIWFVYETLAQTSRIFAYNNTQYLRIDTLYELWFGGNQLTTASLAANTEYRVRLVVNDASSTIEVRDSSNAVVVAETSVTAATVSYDPAVMKIGVDNTIANAFDGSIKLFGHTTDLMSTVEKNNMFDWIHDKIK